MIENLALLAVLWLPVFFIGRWLEMRLGKALLMIDWNAKYPGAPRAGVVASDLAVVAAEMATVFDGGRALGSIHADATRGGMDEFEAILPEIREKANRLGLSVILSREPDQIVGARKDLLVFDRATVAERMRRRDVAGTCEEFLTRSLKEIFPLGSSERYAIDDLYGECSQVGRVERLIGDARRLIFEELAKAEFPAVLWSSGEDSQLLLWLVRDWRRDVSVIHFQSLPSETKHAFANTIIANWQLRLSDIPMVGLDVVARGGEVNIVEEFAVSTDFSLYLPMENEPGRPIDPESACGIKVINEKREKIRPAESRIHDVVFIGHHAGDGDLVLGELKPKEFIAKAADVTMVYPLCDWTKEDVREASRLLGVPQNAQRYGGDMSANPDYFPLCTECLKPGRTEDLLSCPKSGFPVFNLGKLIEPEARREAWRRRFINIEA